MSYKESDIMHENGEYWVLRDKTSYLVMKNEITHSVSESGYPKTDDGKSLAIARCNYLANRRK